MQIALWVLFGVAAELALGIAIGAVLRRASARLELPAEQAPPEPATAMREPAA